MTWWPTSRNYHFPSVSLSSEPLDPDHRRWIVVNGLWPLAKKKSDDSLATARALAAAGFPSPAFVWAVRSAEIFMREAVLFPYFYEQTDDVPLAFRKAQQVFGNGSKWTKALAYVRDQFGLDLSDALTDDGRDAFAVWQTEGVMGRHSMAHGFAEATPEDAERAIAFVDRFIEYFSQRLVIADRGPLRGVLRSAFEEAKRLYDEEVAAEASAYEVDNG